MIVRVCIRIGKRHVGLRETIATKLNDFERAQCCVFNAADSRSGNDSSKIAQKVVITDH